MSPPLAASFRMSFSAKTKPLHCKAMLLPVTASASCVSFRHLQVWSFRTFKALTIGSEQSLSGPGRNNKAQVSRSNLVTRDNTFCPQKTDKYRNLSAYLPPSGITYFPCGDTGRWGISKGNPQNLISISHFLSLGSPFYSLFCPWKHTHKEHVP